MWPQLSNRNRRLQKVTTDPLAFYLIYLMRDVFTTKFRVTLKISKFQCGFCKRFNAKHCLVIMIEMWKENVDNGGAFGAVMTDLSKAFHCLQHGLLTAKLDAYGLWYKISKINSAIPFEKDKVLN